MRLIRASPSWSIRVELYDAAMVSVAYFSDTGYSVCVNVTDEEEARRSRGACDAPAHWANGNSKGSDRMRLRPARTAYVKRWIPPHWHRVSLGDGLGLAGAILVLRG